MERERYQNTAEFSIQNTAEFRLRDTAEIRAQSENGDALNDDYSEKSMKKEKIIAAIVCVVIAFIIWLIISNINMQASTPAPLPLVNNGSTTAMMYTTE